MIDFTEGQKKTVASGITILCLAVVFTFTAFIVWLAFKALAFASAAVVPVAIGFFLSLFFKPYYLWWVKTVKNPALALSLMLLSVFVPLGIFLWYSGAVLVHQVSTLIKQGPQLFEQSVSWLRNTFPAAQVLLSELGIDQGKAGELVENYGAAALKAGSGVFKVLSGLLSALVTLIFFAFFVTSRERSGSDVVAQMPFLKDETKLFVAEQFDAFIDILVSFFQRQTVICLIEGMYYGLGFTLVGLPYGFMIGFVLGVLNLIPLFGSAVCLPIALPIAYFAPGGSGLLLVAVLIVWGIGQFLDGYLITPKIQGDKTGLGYAGVIFSFFFWATVLGPVLGLLLAIPLSAFCVVLWRALKSRYIKPLV